MLTTKQNVFRRYWFATLKIADLQEGPKPFVLLGEKIVLFLDEKGEPAALMDRCCHRTAKLSKGSCEKGLIVCGYHGWAYDRSGALARIPQFQPEQVVPRLAVRAYHCAEKYGYAWVCLGEPLAPIPDIPEETMPGYRRIHQFHHEWQTSPFRLMENSFDNAHFAFVHKNTFGTADQPIPEKYTITETDYGFEAETVITIVNPPMAHRISGTSEPTTKRHMRNKWFMPFCRRLDITYPSGLRHIIFNSATPIDDGRILLAQILYRNDTEEQCSTQELIEWDRVIIEEDRDILESTDPDATMDMSRKVESHMPSDHPGMIMRRRILALLREHGEEEICEAVPAVSVPTAPVLMPADAEVR
jgi:phenylpropionate dioxygenase-like ring-hydroxylating dioxygenase large terminal subunit